MCGVPVSDLLQTAVRAFTTRPEVPPPPADAEQTAQAPAAGVGRRSWRARWREALVWDTETVITPDQRLLVLCWRLYETERGSQPTCLEEGFAYPDDLESDDPAGIRFCEPLRPSMSGRQRRASHANTGAARFAVNRCRGGWSIASTATPTSSGGGLESGADCR